MLRSLYVYLIKKATHKFKEKKLNDLHCGFTVRSAFSAFFIVFTALARAGQKNPGTREKIISINTAYNTLTWATKSKASTDSHHPEP